DLVVVTGSRAGDATAGTFISGGGGASAADGATLRVLDSLFTNNHTDGLALGAGGAIAVDRSTLLVRRTGFLDNQASGPLGARPFSPCQGSGSGGAIASAGGSDTDVSASLFRGNRALGGLGAFGGAGGNAGFGAFGGAILSTNNSVLVPNALGANLSIDH